MKRLSILCSVWMILILSQAAFSQTNWETYCNARFAYSISYPADLLKPQGEADNGDGQIFIGDGAEMRVFGSNMLLNKTLLGEYNALLKQHKNVSYKAYRKNFFVVSGVENGKIFYQKTIAKSGGAFTTFMIEYNESKRAVYDKAVAKIANSFK